jgi:hypothetical protein
MHFRILQDHQKLLFKKDIFYRLEWLKTCFDAFAHTSFQTTKNVFSKKYIIERLEWLKTCFDAFAHTSRPPETFFQKSYFLPSGVVKDVFCSIFAYSQTTKNFFSKKILLNVWSG